MPPKKVTGSKKTDALTLRLDPKHKYLIELTSRLDRKSITGVIETAVQRLAQDRELEFSQRKMTLTAAVEFLWSPDEAERVTNLAQHAPFLLTHEESCIRTVLLDASELFFNCYEVYGKEDLEYRIENLRFRGAKGTIGTQNSFMALFNRDEKKVKQLGILK